MAATSWVQWFPSDFLNGIAELDPHEIALYAVILNRIYDEGGPIRDDVRALARRCNMRPTSCAKALDGLAARGKIVRKEGGITNERCEKSIKSRQKVSKNSAEKARLSWQKRREKANEINDGEMHQHSASISQPDAIPDTIYQKESSLRSDSPRPPMRGDSEEEPVFELVGEDPKAAKARELETALGVYNSAAEYVNGKVGRMIWPKARMTDTRRQKLARRVEEAGGIDGWRQAMRRAVLSPHLTGDNDTGWTASLDFFLQASSFVKLLEGNYDPKQPARDKAAQRAADRTDTLLAGFARTAARRGAAAALPPPAEDQPADDDG